MTLAGLATVADAHASLLKPAPRVSSTPGSTFFFPTASLRCGIGLAPHCARRQSSTLLSRMSLVQAAIHVKGDVEGSAGTCAGGSCFTFSEGCSIGVSKQLRSREHAA